MPSDPSIDFNTPDAQMRCHRVAELVYEFLGKLADEIGGTDYVMSGAGVGLIRRAIEWKPENMAPDLAAQKCVEMLACYAIQTIPDLREKLQTEGLSIPDVGDPRVLN